MTLSIMNSSYSNVLDFIKDDLNLTYTLSGALMSSYFLGYTLGQIPWGFISDKYGSSKVIITSVLGVSASTFLFVFSKNSLIALVIRFISGILGAGIFVPSVKLVSVWFTSNLQGTVLGLLSVGGSIGLIIASLVTPMLTVDYGCRKSLLFFGFLGILISISLNFLLKERSRSIKTQDFNCIKTPVKNKEFWILSLGQFIRLGSYYTFIAWIPLLLREEFDFTIAISSIAMSLFNISGIFSNPLGGAASDKLGERFILMLSFSILSVTVWFFTRNTGTILIFLKIFIIGRFINFVRSPSFTIIPKIYGSEVAGRISGIHNTFASLGALTLPLMLGYVRDLTEGYEIGWIILSILTAFNVFFHYFIKYSKKI